MSDDLFLSQATLDAPIMRLQPGVYYLPGYCLPQQDVLHTAIQQVIAQSPLRRMTTPSGKPMSVSTTSCGQFGWVGDRQGYRYSPVDPLKNAPWPVMPEVIQTLATDAAAMAGFAGFKPDACLMNVYEVGAKMGLHQDKDEQDFSQPIVSVSLGLPIVFQFGGLKRSDPTQRMTLRHGDVLVWGAEARMKFHGVLPLKAGQHAMLGAQRINLTLRKAM